MEKIEITKAEYEEYLRLKKKEENARKLKTKKEQDDLHSKIIEMSILGLEDKEIVEEFEGKLSRASIYKTLRIETKADEERVKKLFARKELAAFRGMEECELNVWLEGRKRKVKDRKQNKNKIIVKSVEDIIDKKRNSHYRMRNIK